MDFVGVSEAVVGFGEADRDVRGDGLDQEHLEHHQDLHKSPGQGPKGRNRSQKTALKST